MIVCSKYCEIQGLHKVDWNEAMNGVQIVVLGFNYRSGGKKPFKVLKRVSLHGDYSGVREKNLQIAGVEEVKHLTEAFQADYVYVDQGHGSMQVETLSKYFFETEQLHKFKSIDFSSNYEMEDIYTGEIRHKRRKIMMVYFLQKRFEMEEIMISSTEESAKGMMIDELNLYNVDRYDSKGQPIYKGEDHILDALMLAVFAFIENYDSIFDRKTGNFVSAFINGISRFTDEFNKDKNKNIVLKSSEDNSLKYNNSLYSINEKLKAIEKYENSYQNNFAHSKIKVIGKGKRKRGGYDFDIF